VGSPNSKQMNEKYPAPEKYSIQKTEAEWKKELSSKDYQILREKATEHAFSGKYDKGEYKDGHFICKACSSPLYSAQAKFDSGCGWPAYDKCYKGAVVTKSDTSYGMRRVEILCGKCGGHLGHVFNGEMKTETNERHCVNSASVKYVKGPPPSTLEEDTVMG